MVFEGAQFLELFSLTRRRPLDGQFRDFRKLVAGHFTVGINELDQA